MGRPLGLLLGGGGGGGRCVEEAVGAEWERGRQSYVGVLEVLLETEIGLWIEVGRTVSKPVE